MFCKTKGISTYNVNKTLSSFTFLCCSMLQMIILYFENNFCRLFNFPIHSLWSKKYFTFQKEIHQQEKVDTEKDIRYTKCFLTFLPLSRLVCRYTILMLYFLCIYLLLLCYTQRKIQTYI